MAAANAALLERAALDAAQQAAEDRRIAAYLADKAARDQVCVDVKCLCSITSTEARGGQRGIVPTSP